MLHLPGREREGRERPIDDGRFVSPRREPVIAAARLFLGIAVLIGLTLDPTEPTHLVPLVDSLMVAYLIYGVLLFFLARRGSLQRAAFAVHAMDLLWAASITALTGGSRSPLFVFFMFTMIAAAFRWGLLQTAGTAVVAIVVTVSETLIVPEVAWLAPDSSGFVDLGRMIIRLASQVTLGLVAGYLAEQEKRWRWELVTLATVMKRPNVAAGMSGTIRAVGDELLRIFRAREVLFVSREPNAADISVWSVKARPGRTVNARLDRLPISDSSRYFFNAPVAWQGRVDDAPMALPPASPQTSALQVGRVTLPLTFTAAHPCSAVLASHITLLNGSEGRVFVLDSALPPRTATLQFLTTLIDYVAPAMHSVYLLRGLRARAGAAERARMAREIHDGAIQALIGLDLEVEALRRRAASAAPALDGDLEYVQGLVRRQVLDLRELMTHLRPLDLESTDQLPDLLASMVEKFRRDTGISARFVASPEPISLTPRAALEVARIVQESLVNVRRHSRAKNVLVSLSTDQGRCRLRVEDDGRGFEFTGRLSDDELDARREGPAIIRERARRLGAAFAIESEPGGGARLELTLPEAASA